MYAAIVQLIHESGLSELEIINWSFTERALRREVQNNLHFGEDGGLRLDAFVWLACEM